MSLDIFSAVKSQLSDHLELRDFSTGHVVSGAHTAKYIECLIFCLPEAHTFAKLRSNCHSVGAARRIKISLLFDPSKSIFNYHTINSRIIHLLRHITFALTMRALMRDLLQTSCTQIYFPFR